MVDIEKLVNTPLDPLSICGTYRRYQTAGAEEYYAARGYCAVLGKAAGYLGGTTFQLEHQAEGDRWSYAFRGPLGIGWPTPHFRFGEEFKVEHTGVQTVLQTVVSVLWLLIKLSGGTRNLQLIYLSV
jgi:hypothetical protein